MIFFIMLINNLNGFCNILSIDSIASLLIQSIEDNNYEQFIRYFPIKENTFNAIFGFYENSFNYDEFPNVNVNTFSASTGILYNKSYRYISFLFDSICNDTTQWQLYGDYLTLILVDLCAEIYDWDADAQNYLQDGMIELINGKKDFWIYTMNLDNEKFHKFWHFIFDGPTANEKLYEQVLSLLTNKHKKQEIIKKTYMDIYKKQRFEGIL